jgi:5'(3')-deoxyribonucleotidase
MVLYIYHFLGTFFLNYCWHWFPKLNWYNCVFSNTYKHVKLDLCICDNFKTRFQVFVSTRIFFEIFFSTTSIFNDAMKQTCEQEWIYLEYFDDGDKIFLEYPYAM